MKLPNSIEKRNLLHGTKPASVDFLKQTAAAFEAEGQIHDAVDFYAKAKEISNLERILVAGCDEGDSFLVLKIFKLMGKDVDEALLLRCAQEAEKASKVRHAILAYERLGNESKVKELKESVKDDLDMKSDVEVDVFIPTSVEELGEE